jgi:hypothetical protein
LNLLNRLFGRGDVKKSHDPEQLQQVVRAYIRARTWAEAQAILWKHSELLSRDVDVLLEQRIAIAQAQNQTDTVHLLQERAYWLRLYHEVGLEQVERILAERKKRSETQLSVRDEDQELRLGELARTLTTQPPYEIKLPQEEMPVEMPISYVYWYSTRLARIPKKLDHGDGQKLCRMIGEQIHEKWGFAGLVKVYEFYRDHVGDEAYATISGAWNGIGKWQD